MNNKYLLNMGLAFDEDRALIKMSNLAAQGWVLKEMTLFKYKFEKTEPQELIYSMDYKELKEDKCEYLELFNESGWKHRCSYGPYHFFSAAKGTVPIYTDKESYLAKYRVSKSIYLKMLIISTLSLIIVSLIDSFVGAKLNNKVIDFILLLAGMVSAGVAAPSLMVTVAYIFRFNKQ